MRRLTSQPAVRNHARLAGKRVNPTGLAAARAVAELKHYKLDNDGLPSSAASEEFFQDRRLELQDEGNVMGNGRAVIDRLLSQGRGPAFAVLGFALLAAVPKSDLGQLGVPCPPIRGQVVPGGSLVIAGGGCVTAEVRERFIALAGGSQGRIVVIPAIDPQPGHEDEWLEPWRRHGAGHVQLLNAKSRELANDPAFCAPLLRATGVWLSGGYQSLLAERYAGTRVEACLKEVLRRDGVVGGCSAGAAILSGVMIEEGEDRPVEAHGFGLMNAIVDQHFLQRNRLWRMQQMLETHPDLVGIGVDEGTALVVELASGTLTPLGESYALVCVPRTEAAEPRIEVLKSGDQVSLSELRKTHLAYHPPPDASRSEAVSKSSVSG